MFSYLSPADAPVIPGLEHNEVVFAKNQPEYIPLRTLYDYSVGGRVLSRWRLTPIQRKSIAEGADIYLELMTMGHPLQPIRLAVNLNPQAGDVADYTLVPPRKSGRQVVIVAGMAGIN